MVDKLSTIQVKFYVNNTNTSIRYTDIDIETFKFPDKDAMIFNKSFDIVLDELGSGISQDSIIQFLRNNLENITKMGSITCDFTLKNHPAIDNFQKFLFKNKILFESSYYKTLTITLDEYLISQHPSFPYPSLVEYLSSEKK